MALPPRNPIRRNRPRHKVHMMVTIFAVGLAYIMLTSAQDVEDINPKVTASFETLSTSLSAESVASTETSTPINGLSENVTIVVNPVLTVNCTPPTINDFPPDLFTPAQRKQGAVVVHFLVSIYIFYAIALVCDDYFVPSIESICHALRLPSDIAGATFMAIATSAPELFTNVIGTFVTHGDLGVGTIVGSAVFNLLAVCALCGLAAKEPLQLDWWSLTRDCSVYSCAVILLLIVLSNRKVIWYEAVLLVCLYLVYLIIMYYNTSCKKWAERLFFGKPTRKESRSTYVTSSWKGGDNLEKAPLMGDPANPSYVDEDEPNPGEQEVISQAQRDEILITKALHEIEANAEEEKDEWGLLSFPWGQGWVKWTEWIIGWPARFFLVFTIPDCRENRFRKWYPVTFVMSIVWIALLTYAMAWMMTVIGSTLSIPDSVMGLTFIAAGTSVPEAVSSIIVTRQGLGSMGISNSIGSNTFDILICLGVPWLIRASIIAPNHIQINSGGLEYSTILLIASVIVLYALLACNKFVLDKRIGIISLCMYGAFLVISSLFELNVFFEVNLPTCTI